MATHATGHVAGHTPAHNNQGWGFALFIVALAVGCWVMAWTVKNNTYLHPTDPRWRAIEPQSHAPAAATAGEHGASLEHGEAPPTPPATQPTPGH